MARKKARNLDQPPIDVHVTEQWSDDSVVALYSTGSRDPHRRFGAVGSLSDSEYGNADSDSFNSLDETRKQTKFLEELLNYTDSVSLDSEGNELRSHGDSSSYSDWARTDRTPSIAVDAERKSRYGNTINTSIATCCSSNGKRSATNATKNGVSAFGSMMGLLTCCAYPSNQTVGESQQQSEATSSTQAATTTALPARQSALVAQSETEDILEHIFNGFENVVCHDSEDDIVGSGGSKDPIIIDRREDRILAPTQRSSVQIRKAENDVLDTVFETFEGFICRDDLATVEASLRSGTRSVNYSADGEKTTEGAAATTANSNAITTIHAKRDLLDNVFEGVEYAMCRDGPPPVNFTNNHKRDNYYAAPARKGYVQSHRGDWRPKPQEYSLDRDNNSIIAPQYGPPDLIENDSFKFSRKMTATGRQDMLDFVFDGVESMVCKDEDIGGPYNIANVRSQFDEDLPNKQFHWDDE